MQIKTRLLKEEIDWYRIEVDNEDGFSILETLLTCKFMCIPYLDMGSKEHIIFELKFKNGNDYKDFKDELCQIGYVKEVYDICDFGTKYTEFHSYRGTKRYLAKKVKLIYTTDYINTTYRLIITPY